MKKIMWTTTFLPLLAASVIVQFMPGRVPMHYDISGSIDRYGSRYEMLIFPALIAVINLISWVAFVYSFEKKARRAEDDKTRMQAENNARYCTAGGIIMPLIMGAVSVLQMYKAASEAKAGAANLELDSMKITALLMGIMIAVLGNLLPKTRRNSGVGLRVSWSLYNDNTWAKSNRYGGRALLIAGVLTAFTALFVNGIAATVMLLVYLTAAMVVSLHYAHEVYDDEIKKEQEKISAAEV